MLQEVADTKGHLPLTWSGKWAFGGGSHSSGDGQSKAATPLELEMTSTQDSDFGQVNPIIAAASKSKRDHGHTIDQANRRLSAIQGVTIFTNPSFRSGGGGGGGGVTASDLDLGDHVDVEVEETGKDDLSDEEEDTSIGGREWSTNVPARRSTINILVPGNTDDGADARAAEDIEAHGAARSPSNDPRTAVVTRRFSTQLL